ncbi:16S rRNA (uracil(1498)-N(3))-methyltransferase [Desulfosediminicola sp.]|uniref:16S rRNA (uracil(1498)-N(3))-methyltransferase n=1 Tax=Desulfosediminicola sp. TaxID=2886825 RepID=UPI003AF26FC4
MNIILAEQEEIVDARLTLTDHRAQHIIKVLRAKAGDIVRFGVVDGKKGTAVIENIHKKHPRSVSLQVELTEPMNPLPHIDLVLALARPIMMRRILSQATALGVGSFHCIHANRVEKSFWEASLVEQESFYDYLLQGLEQAVDTRVPEVTFHRRFKPFVEDFLPEIIENYSHLLVAHPSGNTTLVKAMAHKPQGRVLLAIGPEGGWVDYEVEKFTEAGFTSCTIGERILKVDTAVVALHSRISQLLESS